MDTAIDCIDEPTCLHWLYILSRYRSQVGTAMQTHIARRGNSLALRIPRAMADRLGLGAGGAVELSGAEHRLVVPSSRGRVRLDELLARITPDNLPGGFDD